MKISDDYENTRAPPRCRDGCAHIAVLASAKINHELIPVDDALLVAEALLSDPRKTIPNAGKQPAISGDKLPINVPRGDDGKYLYWAPPMTECDCGTPDGGRHIKYKWPCAYYRKEPADHLGSAGSSWSNSGSDAVKGSGGKGKGQGKGKAKGVSKGKTLNLANFTGEQILAALTSVKAEAETKSKSDGSSSKSELTTSTATPSANGSQSCCVADYSSNAEFEALLNSRRCRAT